MYETIGKTSAFKNNATIKQGLSSWQISSSEWKKNWEHQCALISQTMLSKTNTFNFYRKKSLNNFFLDDIFFVFWRFLDQIWLTKTGFWTNIKMYSFLSIQYLNILQFIKKLLFTTCAFCFMKNQEMVAKAFLMNVTKK